LDGIDGVGLLLCDASMFNVRCLGCDVTQTSSIGTLMSPNYPNGYPNNYNCVQSITVPMANSIQLTFLDINLFYSSSENCLYDWIEVGQSTRILRLSYRSIVNY